MRQLLFLSIIASLAFSCRGPGSSLNESGYARHASGFTVENHDGYAVVELADPWNPGRILHRYILYPRNSQPPGSLPGGTVIRTPVSRLAVYASTHVSMIEALGAVDAIEAVCEPQYIGSAEVREKVTIGAVANLGSSLSPNVEEMINRGVEYIVATPFQNAGYGAAAKTSIPIIEGADYMEQTPLGRAEWIRFFGLLLGREARADSIFAQTEQNYLRLKGLASAAASRPEVLTEKKYGSSWYVPSRGSLMSVMLADAAAANPFDYLAGPGSIPLAFETVLNRAAQSPYWLIKYNTSTALTLSGLKAEYPLYSSFDAYKKRNIYACNTGQTLYHEETPLRPDLLLGDLIRIFHPEILPGRELRYLHKVEE
jgi:iron complex transport system substrate-binding protein